MRKNQVNKILINHTKRRNTVLSFLCVIIILVSLCVTFMYIYNKKNTEQFVTFNENSNIDYRVYLKNNSFFEESYLDSNKQYISNLIDYISAKFHYKLDFDDDNIDHKYSYYIDASVEVKDKTTNNILYSQNDSLVEYKEMVSNEKTTEISELVNINYNKYNDFIKRFVDVYDLSNADSVLNINLHVNIQSLCSEGTKIDEKNSVITLAIPLTTNTLSVDLANDLVNTDNNILRCSDNSKYKWFFVVSIITGIFGVLGVLLMIKYIADTRSAETIYERELKKILSNYGTYIQVLGNGFCFKDYQLLKLDSFTDMLEIRDTIRQPILMKENYQKNSAYFVIPGDTKILYIYRLNVSDIQKELDK